MLAVMNFQKHFFSRRCILSKYIILFTVRPRRGLVHIFGKSPVSVKRFQKKFQEKELIEDIEIGHQKLKIAIFLKSLHQKV